MHNHSKLMQIYRDDTLDCNTWSVLHLKVHYSIIWISQILILTRGSVARLRVPWTTCCSLMCGNFKWCNQVMQSRENSMIFEKIEKVMPLRQSAGRDFVLSIEYCSKLLYQVSKVRFILTRRNSTENRFWFDFETGRVSRYGDFPYIWHLISNFELYSIDST